MDPTKPFEIFANVLNHATGAVLTQRDNNGVQHLRFFYSKPLLPVEKQYLSFQYNSSENLNQTLCRGTKKYQVLT